MIYLDHNATTPLDPRVFEAMKPFLTEFPLNPSSVHRFGQEAKAYLASATREVAQYFDVLPSEIIFTSGATEALNMALQGFSKRGHLLTSSLEHAAVFSTFQKLEKKGADVTYLSPEPHKGSISLEQVEKALKPSTALIALMAANNETGVKTDIAAIADLAQSKSIAFVVDGVALLGKEEFTIPKGVSCMCFSGHKIYGPLGVGVAVVRKQFAFDPLLVGGPQQLGRRAGTENLPAIMGFAKALRLLQEEKDAIQKMRILRDLFEQKLLESLPHSLIHGLHEERISNTSQVAFLGREAETLLMQLDLSGVAVSTGSACSTGALEPSRVLLNMHLPRDVVLSSVRFSLGRNTTEQEIDQVVKIINSIISSSH